MNSRKFPFFPVISLLIALLPLLLSSYLLFLIDPPVWPDEGTSVYMAKTLLETGKMDAGNYGGIPEVAKEAGLGFPPIYFYVLGIWNETFGETIETIRALSLAIGILCVVVFYFLCKGLFSTSKVGSVLGALLLSTNIYFSKAARWGRPEILVLLFILLTLYFWYRRTPKTPRRWALTPSRWTLVASTLFASLALAAHPMGIIAPVVLFLGIIFSKISKFDKLLQTLTLGIMVSLTTTLWLFLTQRSLPGFIEALKLGAIAKAQDPGSAIGLLHLDSLESFLFVGQILIIIALSRRLFKTPRGWALTPSRWVLFTLFVSLFVFSQKEGYYIVYIQPFLILSLILLTPRRWAALAATLILFNLYLQFFSIGSYSPPRKAWELGQFNYHELTREIEKTIACHPALDAGSTQIDSRIRGNDKMCTIFLSSIPDPYIDLRNPPAGGSRYRLLQAIDPDYPVNEAEYKKSLDGSDYVIYTWFPHEYLAYYVSINAEEIDQIAGGGYTVNIAKLKVRENRR